ncbi:hypothetical protein ONS95_006959 [Cadophora gregata]|uniref:uncharacterized protein n=1 Tax=Cadophora gregata TaxID=51156 RepID=UPI0026DAAC94|nr:uncharacterized protein ONS95_006959 [Cadophora gregata]KAK0101809.1 hypothetical protein ONS95_006959 [Cadophora gregata]KAK0106175.1 hypothetical protein ONS96_003822 [Cadophora gregata f. sp. sojae]
MGLFDTAKEKFSSKVNEKATKYSGLSDNALLEKDVKKQRQVNRRQVSTGTAGAACIGTSGISAPIHGSLAAYESGKLAKSGFKSVMTRDIIESRSQARVAQGKPALERRQPTFFQTVSDTTGGVIDGGLGTGAGKDALKAFLDRVGK